MASDLKNKVVKGSFWNFVENIAQIGVGTVFSIILARLLTPNEFGAVAMLTIFIALSNTLVNSGFGSALIRKPDRTEEDYSTAFYFNVVVGLVCYLLLFFASPYIADFYNLPILSPVLKVFAISVIFNSLCVVQYAQLSIVMDFKTMAKISVIANICTGVVAVILAYFGWGIWALVFQSLTGAFMRMGLLWYYAKWRPHTGFSIDSFKQLFGFGSKLLASGLLNTAYNNIYPIVIGKFYSPAQLGLYSRGQLFASVASDNITAIIERVTFPALSQIQDEEERLAIDYRRLIRLSAFVIFPISLLLAAVASPLISILLTSKWSGCVIFLQIMCLSRMWLPVHALNLNLLKVKGRSDLFLKLEIYKKILGILVLFSTVPFGLVAMCWGGVVSSILCLIINTYYTRELIGVGFVRQMLDIFPVLLISAFAWLMAKIPLFIFSNEWIQLISGGLLGLLSFLLITYLVRMPELNEVKDIVRMYRR